MIWQYLDFKGMYVKYGIVTKSCHDTMPLKVIRSLLKGCLILANEHLACLVAYLMRRDGTRKQDSPDETGLVCGL